MSSGRRQQFQKNRPFKLFKREEMSRDNSARYTMILNRTKIMFHVLSAYLDGKCVLCDRPRDPQYSNKKSQFLPLFQTSVIVDCCCLPLTTSVHSSFFTTFLIPFKNQFHHTLFEDNRGFYALMFLRACMETDLLSSAILGLGIIAHSITRLSTPRHLLPQTSGLLFHGHNIDMHYIM